MGPKANPKSGASGTQFTDHDAPGEAPRRSRRGARGTGGTLRQMERIESIQTAPRVPRNAEMRRIKDTLSQQPPNSFAPSESSRKKGKGPEIPYAAPAPPSPVLPRKQLAGSENSFGFYDGRDYPLPPFSQERSRLRRPPSEQEDEEEDGEDSDAAGLSKGNGSGSDDREVASPAPVDGSDDEPGVTPKRRRVHQRVDSEDEIAFASDGEGKQDDRPTDSVLPETALACIGWGRSQSPGDDDDHSGDSLLHKVVRPRAPPGKQNSRNNRPGGSFPPDTTHSGAVFGKRGGDLNEANVQAQSSKDVDRTRGSSLKTARSSVPSAQQHGNVQARKTASDHSNANTKAPSKLSSSKRAASPPTPVQRKIAKKPSTIASRGRGGSAIAGRSRRVPEARDDSDPEPEAQHDVLLDHQLRNGAPHAPDPTYLASLANKSKNRSSTTPSVVTSRDDAVAGQNSVTANSRAGSNNDPTTLKFYDPTWRAILNRAKSLSRFDNIANNAFPERQAYLSKAVAEFITQAMAELKEDGAQPDESILRKYQSHMSDLLYDDLGTYRSDFKKVARQVVAKHWDWEPRDFDGSQQLSDHVLKLYNDITRESEYIHGESDEQGKFDNFSSIALRDLCVTGYYVGKSSLAVSFPDTFSKCLPAGALAFAATALTAALDEYSSGALVSVKFRHEEYSKVNDQFFDIINNIENVPHRLRALKRILKHIATQGCVKNPAVGTGVSTASGGQRNFTAHLD